MATTKKTTVKKKAASKKAAVKKAPAKKAASKKAAVKKAASKKATAKKAPAKKAASKKATAKKAPAKKAASKMAAAKKIQRKKSPPSSPAATDKIPQTLPSQILKKIEQTPQKNNQPVAFLVSPDEIMLSPLWNRDSVGDISTLISSIQTQGLLSPLLVRILKVVDPDTQAWEYRYRVIDGRRRFKALQEARHTEIPVTPWLGDATSPAVLEVSTKDEIDDSDPEVLQEFCASMVANLQRKDNSHPEVARSFYILQQKGDKIDTIAKKMSVTAGSVSQYLRVFDLSQEVQDAFNSGILTISHIRNFARIDGKGFNTFRKRLLKRIEEKKLSPSTVRDIIDAEIQKRGLPEKPKGGRKPKIAGYKPLDFSLPETQKKISPKKPDELVNYYQKAATRLQTLRPSANSSRYLEGVLKGMEISLGVQDSLPF